MKRKFEAPAASHKRLKRNRAGSIILEDGGKITKTQQRELENLTKKLNRRRASIIKSFTPDVKNKYEVFGYDSDLLFRQRKLRYNDFKSYDAYKRYVTQLKAIDVGTDYRSNVAQYKKNYKEALYEAFGKEDGKKLANLVDHVSSKNFGDAILNESLGDIGYLYNKEQQEGKFEIIYAQLKALTTKRK